MSVTIYRGSILDCDVDAIVNPANGFLNHGAGLARVIANAACGPAAKNPGMDEREWHSRERLTDAAKAWKREQRETPTIPTGGVAVTSAGTLPYAGIIHAVGPVWGGGQFCESTLLASAHSEACAAALERGWRSIAFPAISCGLFRFPVALAAPIAVGAVWPFADADPVDLGSNPLAVTFALMDSEHVAAYEDALARVTSAHG